MPASAVSVTGCGSFKTGRIGWNCAGLIAALSLQCEGKYVDPEDSRSRTDDGPLFGATGGRDSTETARSAPLMGHDWTHG
jgi:hypothetical protein